MIFRRVFYSTLLPVKSGINNTFGEIVTILFDGEYRQTFHILFF